MDHNDSDSNSNASTITSEAKPSRKRMCMSAEFNQPMDISPDELLNRLTSTDQALVSNTLEQWIRWISMIEDKLPTMIATSILKSAVRACDDVASEIANRTQLFQCIRRHRNNRMMMLNLLPFFEKMLEIAPTIWWQLITDSTLLNHATSKEAMNRLFKAMSVYPERMWFNLPLERWLNVTLDVELDRAVTSLSILTHDWARANTTSTDSKVWNQRFWHACNQALKNESVSLIGNIAQVLSNVVSIDIYSSKIKHCSDKRIHCWLESAFTLIVIPTTVLHLMSVVIEGLGRNDYEDSWCIKLRKPDDPLFQNIHRCCTMETNDSVRVRLQMEILLLLPMISDEWHSCAIWGKIRDQFVLNPTCDTTVVVAALYYLHRILLGTWKPDVSKLNIPEFGILLQPMINHKIRAATLKMLQGFSWQKYDTYINVRLRSRKLWRGIVACVLDDHHSRVRQEAICLMQQMLTTNAQLHVASDEFTNTLAHQMWTDVRIKSWLLTTLVHKKTNANDDNESSDESSDDDRVFPSLEESQYLLLCAMCRPDTRLLMWNDKAFRDRLVNSANEQKYRLLFRFLSGSRQRVSFARVVWQDDKLRSALLQGLRCHQVSTLKHVSKLTHTRGALYCCMLLLQDSTIATMFWSDWNRQTSLLQAMDRTYRKSPMKVMCWLNRLAVMIPCSLDRLVHHQGLLSKLVHTLALRNASFIRIMRIHHAIGIVQRCSERQYRSMLWNNGSFVEHLVHHASHGSSVAIQAGALAAAVNFALDSTLHDEAQDYFETMVTDAVATADGDEVVIFWAQRLETVLNLDTDDIDMMQFNYPADANRFSHVSERVGVISPSIPNEHAPQCCICQEASANIIIEPCGHVCCCCVCAEQLMRGYETQRKCPMCRFPVKSIVLT